MKPDKGAFLPIMCNFCPKFLPIMCKFYSKFLPIMCKMLANPSKMRERENKWWKIGAI